MQPKVPISRSKLQRPRLAADLVKRKRLLAWFDANQNKHVILVAAPVGFGKTSLLGTWSRTAPFPCAWLVLDADDNDLHRFVSYLVAAVRTVFPGSCVATTALVEAPVLPDTPHLATTLINDLDELPFDFYLLLDNFNTLRDKTILALMSQLIRHLPAQLHLVISTRTDSPLPLARLRADGDLAELRSNDLRFTPAETREFLQEIVPAPLAEEAVQLLHERTEGWAVGLRFASLLFREGTNPQQVVARLASSRKYQLMDYMLNEVLNQYPAHVRQLILRAALLEQFTADLCQALLAESYTTSCRSILEELVQDETLVEVRKDQGTWYRFHALFGEFLRAQALNQFDAALLTEVYRNASAWFAGRRSITNAIEYALKAGEPLTASRLVRDHLHPTLNSEAGRPEIEKWLAFFPAELLENDLDLLRAQLWLAALHGRTSALPELIERTHRLLNELAADNEHVPAIRADIAYALAGKAQWSNDGATAVEIASQYYDKIPTAHEFARGNMLTELALGHQMVGDSDLALSALTDALRKDYSPFSEFTLRALFGFAGVHLNDADFENLARVAERLLQLADTHSHISRVSAHYFMGLVNYEWNKLDAASEHFTAASEMRHLGHAKPGYESFARLALTQQAQGLPDAAEATRRELRNYTQTLRSGSLLYDEAAYGARLALMQGKVEQAMEWVSSVGIPPRPHMIFEVEANLTRLATLLATRQPHHLRTMLDETCALLALAQSLHNKRRVIQLYALKAMAEQALGKRAAARASLEASIVLAEPGGFVRTYLELGPDMIGLLNQLGPKSKAPAYVRRILATQAAPVQAARLPVPTNKIIAPKLPERLTLRERQVLEHLAMRLSDKEIARALVISPLTVKAHTDHIYQKLGVNSRQAAVKVGVEVGILDSNTFQNRGAELKFRS